ncbi:MAG: beta-ketoacyl-[acyl-carrier-protein] synthase II, partial [Coriobacteriia bacterium]|nr:beta-ketoacyl-[acyl-carrier-protein] synthase II [Coriobacteriia bacterium]
MRRVAVTGIGVVSSVGIGLDAMWDSIASGRSGISPIEHFDASEYLTRFAGYVSDFAPQDIIDAKEVRRLSRFQQFAIVAADEAIRDAALDITDDIAPRVGVIVGSGIGGLEFMEAQTAVLNERGPSRVSPFLVPMMITDLAAGHISIRYGAKGINYCPVSACSTGNHAIGEATEA